MKAVIGILVVIVMVLSIAYGQTSKAEKKAKKQADIKNKVETQNYTFIAEYMNPLRGSTRVLTSEYDFRITRDSAISFLPYFGQAYFDVPYNPTDGGVKFTSTKFSYKLKPRKNGGWQITIIPDDVRSVSRLYMDISADGYASLSVNSNGRDEISFNGYLK